MTNFTFFAIAFLSCLLGIILGRMSVINDINQKLKPFKTQKFPIINMGNLYRALRTIISDLDFEQTANRKLANASDIIHNENEELQAKYDKMSEEYKDVLKQLKDKMNECNQLKDQIDSASEEKCRYYHKLQNNKNHFEEFISNAWDNAYGIGRETQDVYDSISDFCPMFSKLSIGIYVTKLKNKTKLLSIGFIKVADNGKITYQDVSRSLGLLSSNENKWAQRLSIPQEMEIGQPYLICAIYPNDMIKRLGDLQSKIRNINGDAFKMQSHINDNKNLLL